MSKPAGDCPVCHKPFAEGDDVVTCPVCGAPYHRACYNQEGKCLFTDRHFSGFEYKPPAAEPPAPPTPGAGDSAGQTSGMLCKNCGTVNESRNIFCESCGAPLHGQAPRAASPGPGYGPAYGAGPAAPVMDLAGDIDGIPKSDWASFVGPSAPTYISRLSAQQSRKSKLGFMFSAFFVSTFYFAYRKLWGWAVLAGVSYLLFLAPSLALMLAEVGYAPMAAFSGETLNILATVTSYLSIARQLLFGVFALYLYRKDAAKKINALRATSAQAAGYRQLVAKKGGVSWVGVVVAAAIFMALYTVFYIYTGDAILNWYYTYFL